MRMLRPMPEQDSIAISVYETDFVCSSGNYLGLPLVSSSSHQACDKIRFGDFGAAESVSSTRNIGRLRLLAHANILDGTDNSTVSGSQG